MPVVNGIVVKPVSIGDISKALGVASLDLGTLCLSSLIELWAKFKPVSSTSVHLEKTTIAATYTSGLELITASTRSDLITKVNAALGSADYKRGDEWTMVKYKRPNLSNGDWARLLDFDGYKHASVLDYTIPTTPNPDGVGPTWGEGYIDLTDDTLENKTLANDAALKTYYNNYMRSTIGTRENLHIYDLFYNIGLPSTRGVIFFTHNGNIYSYEGTVPFKTDAALVNDLASPSGFQSTVVEFYCNPGSLYAVLPTMAYKVVGYAPFSFSGTDLDLDANNYINIIFNYDANFEVFGLLEMALQESPDGGLSWSDVSAATTYRLAYEHAALYPFPAAPGSYEFQNVYRIRQSDIGRNWFRVVIRGTKWNSGDPKVYYKTLTIIKP